MAQRVGRGIALLFHDHSTRRRWVVSITPRPHFTPGKDRVPIVQEAGWAPGPVWTGGKSRPQRDSIPDRPARSQLLYRLSYPTHHIYIYMCVCVCVCVYVCVWRTFSCVVVNSDNPSVSSQNSATFISSYTQILIRLSSNLLHYSSNRFTQKCNTKNLYHSVAQLVEALRYESEGRVGIFHWLNSSGRTTVLLMAGICLPHYKLSQYRWLYRECFQSLGKQIKNKLFFFSQK